MPSLARRLDLLKDESPSAVVDVLKATLISAEPAERKKICRALINTSKPAAAEAIVRYLHRLERSIIPILGNGSIDLRPVMQQLVSQHKRLVTLNALDVIGSLKLVGCLDLLVGLIKSSTTDDDVRQHAATVILAVVKATVGPNGRKQTDPRSVEQLDAPITDALLSYREHRFDEVLIAAAILATRPGPKLAAILAEEDHPIIPVLRGVASQLRRPIVRRNLINWLTISALCGQVQRQFHRLDSAVAFTDVLSCGHLLLTNSRRHAMRRLDRPSHCAAPIALVVNIPPEQQIHLVRLILNLDLRSNAKVSHLADMIALPNAAARMGAVVALLGYESADADQSITQFCFDRDKSVAMTAANRILKKSHKTDEALLRRIERTVHQPLVRQATRLLARQSVTNFFSRWMLLSPLDRLAAVHVVAATNRGSLQEALSNKLMTGSRDERIVAIMLVVRLQMASALHKQLIVQTSSNDSHIVAATVAALGEAPSIATIDSVRAALGHRDARVKANAIESSMRMDPSSIGLIAPMVGVRENRPRANAVRALMRTKPSAGLPQLKAMLSDPDPLHRISGVWAAQRSGTLAIMSQLQKLSKRDRFTEIKCRADIAMKFLLRSPRAITGATSGAVR